MFVSKAKQMPAYPIIVVIFQRCLLVVTVLCEQRAIEDEGGIGNPTKFFLPV
jgi:hypothetical protein